MPTTPCGSAAPPPLTATARKCYRAPLGRFTGRRMRRREFITLIGGAAAASSLWPLAARAQQPAKTIGFLGASTRSAEAQWIAAFLQRLRELGWIEGRTIAITCNRCIPG